MLNRKNIWYRKGTKQLEFTIVQAILSHRHNA